MQKPLTGTNNWSAGEYVVYNEVTLGGDTVMYVHCYTGGNTEPRCEHVVTLGGDKVMCVHGYTEW